MLIMLRLATIHALFVLAAVLPVVTRADNNPITGRSLHAGCTDIKGGVDQFLRAQVGFPSNLRQFFPPAYDVVGEAVAGAAPDTDPRSLFALADIHGAIDTWVEEQIQCKCKGRKNSFFCPYRKWKKWGYDKHASYVQRCPGSRAGREQIKVKIVAHNVLTFGIFISDLVSMGGFTKARTVFGEVHSADRFINRRKWTFGRSTFEWTFEKAEDVDLSLVNYFLRAGEPPPNADPTKWVALDLTPYTVKGEVATQSTSRHDPQCLRIHFEKSNTEYLKPEIQDSKDTPEIEDGKC